MKSYFLNIFKSLRSILKGMLLTAKYAFTKKATIQYPFVKRELPTRTRGQLFCNIDDCIGCKLCAVACPVDCIYITANKKGPTEEINHTSEESGKKPRRFHLPQFDIDFTLCCWCGLCTDVCPTNCLYMTKNYEFSAEKRQQHIWQYGEGHKPGPKTEFNRPGDQLKLYVD